MLSGRLTVAALVSIATGLWLVHAHASLLGLLVFLLGGALVTSAAFALTSSRRSTPARVTIIRSAAPFVPAPEQRAHTRLDRTPRGRSARDVRCQSSRATARGRRSTRR